eukprot:CAMPEP_0114010444 /NCGR_PEP_ID=MMETSP0372-20130328/7575_1 /TAXON_ID=340204 /ORGANISM="Lankesteria abbotti" /LENGTH=41 /assembly_acc=CAM_ASM_000359
MKDRISTQNQQRVTMEMVQTAPSHRYAHRYAHQHAHQHAHR